MTEHILVALEAEPAGLDRLRGLMADAGGAIDVIDEFGPDQELDPSLAADVTAMLGAALPRNVAQMGRLDWLQLTSAGFAQLAGTRPARPLTVTNASGVNDIPIAEWSVMMLLALYRRLPLMQRHQQGHVWDRDAVHQAELRGRRIGVFGYGNIGQECARLFRSLGLEIWTLTRSTPAPRSAQYDPLNRTADDFPVPDRSFTLDQRADFYAGLDALLITTPLTSATRGFIDVKALAQLPSHALLLNPARANIVDEAALRWALTSGTIAGAAFDVHYRNPLPVDDPTWDLPNLSVTPHISGSLASTYCVPRIWDLFCRNVERRLAGSPLLNVVPATDIEFGS